jgi:tryptophanyl-tRNA synthetase
MSEGKLDFQTWICPKCFDDHRMDGECSPIEVNKMFMPSENDHSHIANEYRRMSILLETAQKEIEQLNKKIEKIREKNRKLNDYIEHMDDETWD